MTRLNIIFAVVLSFSYHTVTDFLYRPSFIDPETPQFQLLLPVKLTIEEQYSDDGEYEVSRGVRIQVRAPRMHYPYIDGASRECERLSEPELQRKRERPEVSITCTQWR